MKFWKMNGAGNDFVLINNMHEKLPADKFPEIARIVCERHMSLGADGLMVVDAPSPGVKADYRMIFYNSDGSLGEMCGNGARCICRYGYETGLANETPVIETTAGIVTGQRIDESLYRIRLNDPSVIELHKKLRLEADTGSHNNAEGAGSGRAGSQKSSIISDGGLDIDCSYIVLGDPGIPHLVVRYEGNVAALCGSEHLIDADENALRELGRALRRHKDLSKGANVNFVELTGANEVYERTFERGVEDFTYACGTGTGCAAAALTLSGDVSGSGVRFIMKGGELLMDVEETDELSDGALSVHGLYLTGPTNIAAKGELTDENLMKLLG